MEDVRGTAQGSDFPLAQPLQEGLGGVCRRKAWRSEMTGKPSTCPLRTRQKAPSEPHLGTDFFVQVSCELVNPVGKSSGFNPFALSLRKSDLDKSCTMNHPASAPGVSPLHVACSCSGSLARLASRRSRVTPAVSRGAVHLPRSHPHGTARHGTNTLATPAARPTGCVRGGAVQKEQGVCEGVHTVCARRGKA